MRAYTFLYGIIVNESSNALNVAIQRLWVAFNPTETGWVASPTSRCQHGGVAWLSTESKSLGGGENVPVHYCLVTGELRVKGFPLNRLPSEYEAYPIYSRLFGSAVLEVMPGLIPGIAFSSKKCYAGHQVYFSLTRNSEGRRDLLVKAVRCSRVWEFINPRLIKGFPLRFISDYVHW